MTDRSADIEAVARAIARDFGIDPDVFIGMHGRYKWEKEWHSEATAAIEALRPFREAAEAKVRAEAWQPIETAPKDGSVIDLWLAPITEEGKALTPCRAPNCYWDERAWYCDRHVRVWHRVTHWRPLPDPPAILQRGGEK